MSREFGNSTSFRELLTLAEDFGSTNLDVKALLQDPDQVIDSLERFGTVKLGEFEIEVPCQTPGQPIFPSLQQEKYVIRAFEGKPMLTMGLEEYIPVDWRTKWIDILHKSWQSSTKQQRTLASGPLDRICNP